MRDNADYVAERRSAAWSPSTLIPAGVPSEPHVSAPDPVAIAPVESHLGHKLSRILRNLTARSQQTIQFVPPGIDAAVARMAVDASLAGPIALVPADVDRPLLELPGHGYGDAAAVAPLRDQASLDGDPFDLMNDRHRRPDPISPGQSPASRPPTQQI